MKVNLYDGKNQFLAGMEGNCQYRLYRNKSEDGQSRLILEGGQILFPLPLQPSAFNLSTVSREKHLRIDLGDVVTLIDEGSSKGSGLDGERFTQTTISEEGRHDLSLGYLMLYLELRE